MSMVLVTSCDKDDPKPNPTPDNEIGLDKTEVTLTQGETTATVQITSGSGSYTIEVDNNKVEAVLTGNIIAIRAIEEGVAKITVTDTQTHKKSVITVTVENLGGGGGGADEHLTLDKTEVSIDKDETDRVNITSGSGSYTFDIISDDNNPNFISVAIQGNIIAIIGNEVGKGAVIITDTKTNEKMSINVEVGGPSIIFTTSKSLGELVGISLHAWEEDQPNVWIDLNNNKIRDDGESPSSFAGNHWSYGQYAIQSQTIAVYGKINNFNIVGDENEDGQITSLDVSKADELQHLTCDYNSQLEYLDISKTKRLETLHFNNTGVRNVKLDNENLSELHSEECEYLTYLDASKCINLRTLRCEKSALTSIDVSNCTRLEGLLLRDNNLTGLDVSTNSNLGSLKVTNNPNLTCIKVSQSQLDNIPANWKKDDTASYNINCD